MAMRNAWKSKLLVRSLSRPESSAALPRSQHFPLHRILDPRNPCPGHRFLAPGGAAASDPRDPRPFFFRRFSSSSSDSDASLDDEKRRSISLAVEIFSKPSCAQEIQAEIEAAGLDLDHEAVNSAFRGLDGSAEAAGRLFSWAMERKPQILCSESFNLMLGTLGAGGKSNEFWSLLDAMKKRGHDIERGSYTKASEGFRSSGMEKDLAMLRELFEICEALKAGDNSEEIAKSLDGWRESLSEDSVVAVLESRARYPSKALLFFQWAEENLSSKLVVGSRAYYSILNILARGGCEADFSAILVRMRNEGGGEKLNMETYNAISAQLLERKMVSQAVELYELTVGGVGDGATSQRPGLPELVLLLKKIAVSGKAPADMAELVARAVGSYRNAGNCDPFLVSTFVDVHKLLARVGRLSVCREAFKAIEDGGLHGGRRTAWDLVIVGLCRASLAQEALECMEEMMKDIGHYPGTAAWKALVAEFCDSGEAEKAITCFGKVADMKRPDAGLVLEQLVMGLSRKKNRAAAVKVLKEIVMEKRWNLEPSRSTFMFLIRGFLGEGELDEAMGVLSLMARSRSSTYPCLEHFAGYFAKEGTVDEMLCFLKTMKVTRGAFLRLFQALLGAAGGRRVVAHDLLSRSPSWLRNDANVLGLFYTLRGEGETDVPSYRGSLD